MDRKKRRKICSTLFIAATMSLLAFGVFSQILCEAMGYTPGLLRYLLGLIPACVVGFLAYAAVVHFPHGGKFCRFVKSLLLIAVVLWTILFGMVIAYLQMEDDQFVVYGAGWLYAWAYPEDETQYMLTKSHLFGHGDSYYEYPEALTESYTRGQTDLPVEAWHAFEERDRAEAVFRDYRTNRMLPVLSYTYGLWVSFLFAALAVGWCVAAMIALFLVHRWWEKLVYLLCFCLIAAQLILPLLGSFGMISSWIPHPFSLNWRVNVTAIAPQLGVMAGLVKVSRKDAHGAGRSLLEGSPELT